MADLGIIDADPSEPPSSEDVISLANRLLTEFNISTKVEQVEHISAALFVVLYERLFSDRLPGIVRQPYSKEDEIHNCQTVIDVLSTEIVHDSLSHIRGADIIAGNITAISNLLDIFSYLLEYVVNKIESDVPTDIEESRSITTTERNSEFDLVSENSKSLGKARIASKKPGNGKTASRKGEKPQKGLKSMDGLRQSHGTSLNKNENRSLVISHEDYYNLTVSGDNGTARYRIEPPSSIQHDQSQSSLRGQKTMDSTDLDLEDGNVKASPRSFNPPSLKMAWDEHKDTKFAEIPRPDVNGTEKSAAAAAVATSTAAAVATSTAAATGPTIDDDEAAKKSGPISKDANDLEERVKGSREPLFAASMPIVNGQSKGKRSDPMRATVGPIEYRSSQRPQQSHGKEGVGKSSDPGTIKGLSGSYDDLQHQVEKTVALTRLAVLDSPVAWGLERDLDITDMGERPRPTISSEGTRRTKELNARGMMKSMQRKREISPRRPGKTVGFYHLEDDKYKDRFEDLHSPLGALHGNENFDLTSCESNGGLSEFTSSGYPFINGQSRSSTKYNGESNHGPSNSSSCGVRGDKSRADALALHLARNRQPELGAAHMSLKAEDRTERKKQEFLRRMYDDDLAEFSEDVREMRDKDGLTSKQIEEQLLKSYDQSAAKTVGRSVQKAKNTKTIAQCKKPRLNRARRAKSKLSAKAQRSTPAPLPLDLKSEEDLLPVLLEEFPHLHLSDHTWHELWRKGLNQIEGLTRCYQEVKHKTSHAQNQMEDASKRHDLLSSIMAKQLEHTKRLREVKEQKSQQVQIRNKTHDRRIQSATARRYYNEFQVRARSKQLKRRTREEMVFRELFKDALSIQKDRIKDIRQYTSDQRKRQEEKRQGEIQSLENFYQDQFEMLAEKLYKERKENSIRNVAQQQMLDRMKRELRVKMEKEIKMYQEQMFRDEDSAHFRQMDSDKVKQQLHVARYTTII